MTATAINQVAAGHSALLDAVYTFLTTHADLVLAGEEWVSMEYTAGESFIIKGVGMGGTDEIYIGWRVVEDTGNDVYNIEIRGFGGYTSGGVSWEVQPFPMPFSTYLCSYDQPLNYWIIANGRRFIIIEKVSTVYLSCYCGLFLPYATPTQYPYPLCVSASTDVWNNRWSEDVNIHQAAIPNYSSLSTETSGYVYTQSGWKAMYNRGSTGSYGDGLVYMSPSHDTDQTKKTRENIDGSYTVDAYIIINRESPSIEGELEGYGWVTGFGQTSESTITFDGDSWLVVQDIHRTEIEDYFAVRLL